LSDIPALKPYRGKPAVRNFREGNGNVGIMRSPLRAIALPDQSQSDHLQASVIPVGTLVPLPTLWRCNGAGIGSPKRCSICVMSRREHAWALYQYTRERYSGSGTAGTTDSYGLTPSPRNSIRRRLSAPESWAAEGWELKGHRGRWIFVSLF